MVIYLQQHRNLHVREVNGQSDQVLFWQHGAMQSQRVILQAEKEKGGITTTRQKMITYFI